jgi:hypothetical protein
VRFVWINRVREPGETVIEILKSFEQVAGRFSPMVLLVPGLAMVVLGLLAWLAGMCLRRLVLAIAGAAAGGIAGLLIHGQNPAVAGLAAGGGAVFGAILPRFSIAVLLAAFGLSIAFVITAKPHLVERPKTLLGNQDAGRGDRRLNAQESLDVTRVYILDLVDCTKSAARVLKLVNYAILAAVGLGLLLLGLFLGRLAGPLVFSLLGTSLIFAGLITLLIFKGSAPIALVQQQGAFFGLVLLGMAAFGTLEQLVLCPASRRKQKAGSGGSRPSPTRSSAAGQEESEHGWRGR